MSVSSLPSNDGCRAWIYGLKCTHNKYYVGRTTREAPGGRFWEHDSGKGSAWTKLYPPLQVLFCKRQEHEFDEDKETLEMMLIHGIANVRGGTFVKPELQPYLKETLKAMLHSRKNRCFNCGESDHYAAACPLLVAATPVPVVKQGSSSSGSINGKPRQPLQTEQTQETNISPTSLFFPETAGNNTLHKQLHIHNQFSFQNKNARRKKCVKTKPTTTTKTKTKTTTKAKTATKAKTRTTTAKAKANVSKAKSTKAKTTKVKSPATKKMPVKRKSSVSKSKPKPKQAKQ